MSIDFVTVKVQIGKTVKNIKMEKGVAFENKGGRYVVDDDGNLQMLDKKTNTWKPANAIKMTNYQYGAFQAVANNEKEGKDVIYSKADILKTQQFKDEEFQTDMAEFLPKGYKIERPKMSTDEKYVQAYVTNGKEAQSATLKFQIAEIENLKKASADYQNTSTSASKRHTIPKEVAKEHFGILDADGDGIFNFDPHDYESCYRLPYPISSYTFDGSPEWDKFAAKITALNGQKITPNLIDKLVNILLDEERAMTYEGESTYTTDSPGTDMARFVDYLKPNTIDKLLDKGSFTMRYDTEEEGDGLKALLKLYDRLNDKQKDKYYDIIFSESFNRDSSIFLTPDTWQMSGERLADYVFEDKLSDKNYEKVKNFITTMNQDNGIARTRTQCKNLIESLYDGKKITAEQHAELLKINQTSEK